MSCDHPGPVQCVGFNPKFMMLSTSCTNMVNSSFNFYHKPTNSSNLKEFKYKLSKIKLYSQYIIQCFLEDFYNIHVHRMT
jgi:hypothetical protein